MIIDCVGCLHGAKPELGGGDLLIVTGDLTANDQDYQYHLFGDWICEQNYRKKIVIGGNHDNFVQKHSISFSSLGFDYLQDFGCEFEGLKIWGSPWTSRFEGINPHCCAFTGADDDEIAPHFELIPPDVDILITHGPPLNIRDKTVRGKHAGSVSLRSKVYLSNARLHIFSHIHESYGIANAHIRVNPKQKLRECTFVNCSIMNERYEPINKPQRVILPDAK